jgi:hypothetical protein
MSWGAQNRSKDAKTPSVAGGRSKKPELGCCPIQPYYNNTHTPQQHTYYHTFLLDAPQRSVSPSSELPSWFSCCCHIIGSVVARNLAGGPDTVRVEANDPTANKAPYFAYVLPYFTLVLQTRTANGAGVSTAYHVEHMLPLFLLRFVVLATCNSHLH